MAEKRASSTTGTDPEPDRFDVATLRETAGDTIYNRGVVYFEDGDVEIISLEENRVFATVFGSEAYETELHGGGRTFSGWCSCPAYSNWGFCKHMVATALAANDTSRSNGTTVADRFAHIRAHLQKKSVDDLIETIVDLAQRDRAFLAKLELAATVDTADDDRLLAQFTKLVTDAIEPDGYIDYHGARSWAQGVHDVLDQIETLVDSGRVALVLRLMDHVFSELDEAIAGADDSNGYCGAAYGRACDIHLAACEAAPPDPIQLARGLFERELETIGDYFYAADETYADILGDAGQAEYQRLALDAWSKIAPIQRGDRTVYDNEFPARHQIAAILERAAKRDTDVDAQIAIRSKDLSSAHAYLGIAQICLDAGREDEALRWAEEGLWQFDNEPDERLHFFTADLYRRMGRSQDAEKLVWDAFAHRPSLRLYRQIMAMAEDDAQAQRAVYDRAVGLLKKQIAEPACKGIHFENPAFILVQILMTEQDFTEAWRIVHEHEPSPFLVEELADASFKTHPVDALRVYERRAEDAIRRSMGNYDEAGKFIERMRAIREELGERALHLAFVYDLMKRHKAKRNFMKLMRAQGYGETAS